MYPISQAMPHIVKIANAQVATAKPMAMNHHLFLSALAGLNVLPEDMSCGDSKTPCNPFVTTTFYHNSFRL